MKSMMCALALIILLVATAAAQDCYVQTCVGFGDRCDTTTCNDPSSTSCTRKCPTLAGCEGATGREVCTASPNGAECDTAAGIDCKSNGLDPLDYTCILGKCVAAISGDSMPGDRCVTSDNCKNSFPCVSGKCQGRSLGADCTKNEHCEPELYCFNAGSGDKCTARPAVGAACSANSDCFHGQCESSVCVELFAKALGQSCDADEECGKDATCSSSVCTTVPASSMGFCNNTAGFACSNGDEVCMCDSKNGHDVCVVGTAEAEAQCNEQRKSYNDCLITNKCHEKSDVGNVDSCAYQNCASQKISMDACMDVVYDFLKDDSCQGSPASVLISFVSKIF